MVWHCPHGKETGMSRVVRPDTAFSLSSRREKRPRAEDGKHLAWTRTLPCLVTGLRPVDPAHIRYGDMKYGKRETGKSEKPDDKWVVPLHRSIHTDQHAAGERAWWAEKKIDPLPIALALWGCSGDDDIAEVILREARP